MFIPGPTGPTFIPTPMSSSSRREEPKCPHCDKELKGWSKPCDTSLTEFLIGSFILINFIAAFVGGMNGSFDRCDSFFSKRYHYIIPGAPAACMAVRWLSNKEEITNYDYDVNSCKYAYYGGCQFEFKNDPNFGKPNCKELEIQECIDGIKK